MCRFECKKNISEEEREKIFHSFWSLADITRQRDFILKCSTVRNTKCKTPSKNPRERTIIYSLNGHRVCKLFFLHTMDISDQMVYTAHLKAVNPEGICNSDKRGTHQSRPNKTKKQDLINIRKFPRLESHYCRKKYSERVSSFRHVTCKNVSSVSGRIYKTKSCPSILFCLQKDIQHRI